MICFQISIFEPLGTIKPVKGWRRAGLWFAFKLVSLNHWEQYGERQTRVLLVVICFQISIFEPLGTILGRKSPETRRLWFAFKLVSLNHWEQLGVERDENATVVICFQISIFEPLGTIIREAATLKPGLWFAFKLVSLNHWEQYKRCTILCKRSCDLLSN